jgi:hypothetical protein
MAANCLKEVTAAGLTLPDSVLDYTAKQTPPGLPPHTLHIKVNGIYRLIHNFFINHRLVKNAWVVVSRDRDGQSIDHSAPYSLQGEYDVRGR